MSDRTACFAEVRSDCFSDIRPLSFAGLVALAGSLNPIPSRTRPLNSPAPMVLSPKAWKSRSLPGLQRTDDPHHDISLVQLSARIKNSRRGFPRRLFYFARGFGAA